MANQDPALKATLLFLTALSLQFLTPLSLHFLYTWLATAWTCPLELQDGDTGSFLCPEPHKVLFDFNMTSMLISPKKNSMLLLRDWAASMIQTIKNLPVVQEMWVQSLGREDPLEKEMATHFIIVAGKSHG